MLSFFTAAVLAAFMMFTSGCQAQPVMPDSPPITQVETELPITPEPDKTTDMDSSGVIPFPDYQPAQTKNNTLYILMFHHVVEDGVSYNNWTITTSRLREELTWLRDHGYTPVLPSELAAGLALPERAVMITFDDGYASNYELALPILEEYQAKAVISLITSAIENDPDFLTWDMCQKLLDSGLIEIGSHTHNAHSEKTRGVRRLEGETRAEYEARIFPDIEESVTLIEEHLGVTPVFFAYPHGESDRWSNAFIDDLFDVTVTTQHGPANISNGLYRMPRHNITVEQPASDFLPS